MRNLVKVFGYSIALGLSLVVTNDSLVHADVSSLTTSPVSINLSIKPGSSATTTLEVMNNSSSPVNINLKLETFAGFGQTGQAKIFPAALNNSSLGWVKFSKKTIVAQPGVWEPVKMTISLPSSASLGYYYAVLFNPSIHTTTPGKRVTIVKGANAVLVLVDTHSTNESRALSLSSFTSLKGIYEYLPASFSVTVHNTGNIYVAPEGNIYISRDSNFHNIIDTLNLNQGGGNVLPNSKRVFTAQWSNGFPVYQPKLVNGQPLTSKGKPVEQLNWNFSKISKLRFGKYYAQVALVYSNGIRDIPMTAVVSFWVIPWELLMISFILLLVILAGAWSLGKLVAKNAIKIRNRIMRIK